MSLVSSDWLEKNLKNVKIIDCSWHMPGTNRNPYEEYLSKHIPGAIFFDLDKNSEQKTDLPHMLPTREKWEEILSSLGISNNDVTPPNTAALLPLSKSSASVEPGSLK